jgi:hypothetical protein
MLPTTIKRNVFAGTRRLSVSPKGKSMIEIAYVQHAIEDRDDTTLLGKITTTMPWVHFKVINII